MRGELYPDFNVACVSRHQIHTTSTTQPTTSTFIFYTTAY